MRRHWVGLTMLAGVLLLIAAGAGAFDGPAPTGDSLGLRRFLTPEVAGATQITEQFVMNRAGLRSIALRAAAVGRVDGDIRVDLWQVRGHDASLVRHGVLRARDLAERGVYRFEFAPLSDSRNATYRLVLASSSDHPSHGVAFWATRGDRLEDATLMYGTIDRWADLAFRTDTVPPPPMRPAAMLALAILAVSWVAFVQFLASLHATLRLSA